MIYVIPRIWKDLTKIARFVYLVQIGSQKYRRIFFFFWIAYPVYSQIWLYYLPRVDDHFGYITKLTPKIYIYTGVDRQPYCEKTFLFSSFWEYSFTFDPISEPFEWKRQISTPRALAIFPFLAFFLRELPLWCKVLHDSLKSFVIRFLCFRLTWRTFPCCCCRVMTTSPVFF